MNTTKVLIIGAGPAGIAAATRLLELGFERVRLVEAENRIGGRIHTIPFGDNVMDLGAQWCHGEKDNVVYELASKQDLLESAGDVLENHQFIRSNKEVAPIKVYQRLDAILKEYLETRKSDLLSYEGSLESYATSKYFEALRRPENSDIDMAIAKELFENFQKFENSVVGCDTLADVSSKGFLEFWECEGDNNLNWKDKGYLEFLRLLMKSRGKDSELGVLDQRVLLGKPVKQILWNGASVQVKCEDGELIEADHVIVTVSLGVLKLKHSTLFEPKLPAEKVRTIEALGFGTVDKICVLFPSQFWPNDWNGFSILWREEDLAEIRGTDRAWLEDVYGFYTVNHKPKILCGWITGVNARHMETLSEDEVLNGCMYLFRKFLSWDIPTPVRLVATAWHKNENFRGSYSFNSMMTEMMNCKRSDLASPLTNSDQKPVVLFAGEATSDHHFSTVHGAVESGWREAERLTNLYNSSKAGELEAV